MNGQRGRHGGTFVAAGRKNTPIDLCEPPDGAAWWPWNATRKNTPASLKLAVEKLPGGNGGPTSATGSGAPYEKT